MEEKTKVRIVNIIIIIIDIILLGVICGNHCRVPDQVMVQNVEKNHHNQLTMIIDD